MPAAFDAQHPGNLPERHLHAHSGEEADQHRARQEVRQKSEPDQAREQQKPRRHEREHGRQRDVLIGAHRGQADQPRRQDGRRRRVGTHHQMP